VVRERAILGKSSSAATATSTVAMTAMAGLVLGKAIFTCSQLLGM
jgi:hypothetical protein